MPQPHPAGVHLLCRAVATSMGNMIFIALMFIALAALLHVFIFYLEVFAWDGPQARSVFGAASAQELETTRFMAYNQGVYNLMLAVVAALGIVFWLVGKHEAGAALMFAGAGSMIVAALALALKSPSHRSAAAKQAAFAVIGVVLLGITLL